MLNLLVMAVSAKLLAQQGFSCSLTSSCVAAFTYLDVSLVIVTIDEQ